jgi:phosphatidylinositol alpha-mannosyltransferase
MKIALVLDDSLDRPDGVQQYVLSVGTYLASVGHNVHYVCSSASRTDLEQPLHSLVGNFEVTFNGNGLRIPRVASRRVLRAFVERERFDVLHVQMPHSPLFSARLVRQARRVQGRAVTIVGTFHIFPNGRIASLGTRLLGLVLRRNLRAFDRFCAVSAPAAAFARASFGIEPEVIGIPVPVAALAAAAAARPAPPDSSDRVHLAFLGRLVQRKGVLEFVDALGALAPDVRDRVRVTIGGRGPLTADVERAIERHHLQDVVGMWGFVAEEEKPAFYGQADIAVFPATGGESFGIVLTEAMASGSGVVIGGDNPGYRSVLGDSPDVLVDPRDTAAFAALLTRLIDDPALRASIRAEQQVRVLAFDVGVIGPQIEALYGRRPAA